MVKPIPHNTLTARICRMPMPFGRRANPVLIASQLISEIPSGLPTNNPSMIPSGTGVARLARLTPANEIPALANANNGRIR